jgi:abhydrolase domain-containing protein 17
LLGERMMFQPPRASYTAATLPVTHVPVGAGDSLAVVHLPNPAARYTILYSHGNAEDLGHIRFVLEELHAAGFAVLAYDYRGYGLSSPVRTTAARASEDIEAVYHFAVHSLGIPPRELILHGRSIGSGPTLELAARYPAAGVVLESAFTTANRVVTHVPLLPFDRFHNLAVVRQLERPLLVMHGTRDMIIRPSHGRRLFAAAAEPKRALWIDGAGHNDFVEVAGRRYGEALREFARLLDAVAAAAHE